MIPVVEMTEGEKHLDLDSGRTGRQVERDFALVNLRRVTVGTALTSAALVGMISIGLAGQAANARPVALPLPNPTAAVVVVQVPVPVVVRVPVAVSNANGGYSMASPRRVGASNGAAPQASSPSHGAAPSPAVVVPPRPAPTPAPPPACTSSPSLCPKK
jgi:hypothetical protein